MSSINKVILIGRLGQDPKVFEGGVVKFSVATSEKRGDSEETEWHNCVAFKKTAEYIGKYLKKGCLVYLEGRIKTQEYKGERRKEIIAWQVQNLGGQSTQHLGGSGQSTSVKQVIADAYQNHQSATSLDDDLPF